jgi:NAD-dependent SIR2 family protein deacetylase
VQNIDLGGVHGKVNEIQCTRCHSSVGHSDQSASLRMPRLFGGWNDFSK